MADEQAGTMQRFSLWQVPFLSCFSAPLYRDIASRAGPFPVVYLLLLVSACWIPAFIGAQREIAEFMSRQAPALLEQVPHIEIRNGEVATDAVEPHPILDPESNKILAIIDTTGRLNSLDGSDAYLLLTRRRLVVNSPAGSGMRIYNLANVGHLALDRGTVTRWLEAAATWGPILLYPFTVLGAFLYHLIEAVFYASMSRFFRARLRSSLTFLPMFRIATVAVTPAMILGTFADAFDIALPGGWFTLALLSLGYVTFGIRAARAAETPPTFSI